MMNAGIYKGNSGILLTRFNAETVFDLMQKHKVTIFAGVPTMYWGLLNYTNPKFDYEEHRRNFETMPLRRRFFTGESA